MYSPITPRLTNWTPEKNVMAAARKLNPGTADWSTKYLMTTNANKPKPNAAHTNPNALTHRNGRVL
jgi:hypothetical protein